MSKEEIIQMIENEIKYIQDQLISSGAEMEDYYTGQLVALAHIREKIKEETK